MNIKLFFLTLIFLKASNCTNNSTNFSYSNMKPLLFDKINYKENDFILFNNNGSDYQFDLYRFFLDITSDIIEYIIGNSNFSNRCYDFFKFVLEDYQKYKENYTDENWKIQNFPHKILVTNIVQSSSLDKNRFNYESCRHIKNYSYYVVVIDSTTSNIKNYHDKILSNISKKLIDYEDSFYVYGLCLPYNEKDVNCTDEDYKSVIENGNLYIKNLLFPEGSDIKVYLTKIVVNSRILAIIILVLLGIQFILITFNYPIYLILKQIFKKEKEKIINQQDEEEEENEEDNNKYIIPKSLIKINSCFSFRENLEELFNLKNNSTENNNYSGLGEIRGLNAISIILTQLGLTFIAIYNSPLKVVGTSQMKIFFQSMFYFVIFISSRYSPRIIFSCSGYTLSYKYLCYIEKRKNNFSALKFIFYQFHKYLIFIFLILFYRYSLNFIIINTLGEYLPNWVFFQKSLVDKYDSIYKLCLSFLGYELFLENKKKKADQNLTDYFWMPFNEIYFFIFGVFLITIGYKCKLKIDKFILILILFIFIGKIVFSYYYRNEYYSTLYYYLFDYGKFMINPLFNLTYFLIGLYFGLINYALQKGVANQNKLSIYDRIKNYSFDMNDEIEKENKGNDINNENENKQNEENKSEDIKAFKTNNNDFNNEELNKILNKKEDNSKGREKTIKIQNSNYKASFKFCQEMPFLFVIIKYINFIKEKKNHNRNWIINILFFILFILILIPFIAHYLILYLYHKDKDIEEKKKEINILNKKEKYGDFYKILNLDKYISNTFLNAILRVDIEIFIFFIHWIILIVQIKGYASILMFLRHIIWGLNTKSYFSFTIISNMVILFVIYSNESIILVNIYIIFFFFILNSVTIFIFESINYIYLELPLKKFIKHICLNQKKGNEPEEYDLDKENDNEKKVLNDD